MRKEISTSTQLFRPAQSLSMRSKEEALEELLQPCGRFKVPLPLEERIQANIARSFGRFDPLRGSELSRSPSIPLNWQLLLRYLHREKVIGDPQFHFDIFPNDAPKMISGWLSANWGDVDVKGLSAEGAAFGNAGTLEEALSKAVGEAIERYFFRQFHDVNLTGSSYNDLRRRKRTLDIFDLNGFLPWQVEKFPQFKRDPNGSLKWIAGEELKTGRKTYLPAQVVFWNYPIWEKEVVLLNPTTSGCAGHFTKEEAMLGSLLELIQRDGFLIYWLNALSPNVLDVSTVADAEFQELLAYAQRYRLKLVFLNTSSELPVPSVTCVVVDELGQEPTITVGAGTGFDLAGILLHAAREALSVYSYVSRVPRFPLPQQYVPFSDPSITRNERLSVWRGKEMLKRFEFFISGKKQDAKEFIGDAERLTSVEDRLAYLLKMFDAKGKGYEVYLYEIRNSVLDQLGYHLVRTIVPQLVPIHLVETMPTLDSKRLRELPEKLGYKSAREMNPWPHPFP